MSEEPTGKKRGRQIERKHHFEETTGSESTNPDMWTDDEIADVLGESTGFGSSTVAPASKGMPDGDVQAAVAKAIEEDFAQESDPEEAVAKARDQWSWLDWEELKREHERQNMSEHELLREISDSLQQLTGGAVGKATDAEQAPEVDPQEIAKAVAALSEEQTGKPETPSEPSLPADADADADDESESDGESVGPFEDHAACVGYFEAETDVENPEMVCDAVAANPSLAEEYDLTDGDVAAFLEELENPKAANVLRDLQVSYVSGVENPAQDSQWIMAKDADDHGADWGVTAPLLVRKADDGEEQKAWAPVLIPNETDKQGDVIPPNEIERAAHTFLTEFRNIDTDHDLLAGKGVPIESWTLKEASTFTLPDGSESREYPAGTWMLGVEFDDRAWKRVKDGDLTGFSIYGDAEEIPADAFREADATPEVA